MRDDMHRKVIECYRWGSRWLKNEEVRWNRQALQHARDADDFAQLPSRIGMRPRRGSRKHFGDNLAPLRNFLSARLGAHWDDVYSELRAGMSTRSVIHMHIFEHLEHMVSQDVIIDGERVLARTTGRELIRRKYVFYVHPETRRLMQPTRTWKDAYGAPEIARAPHVDLGEGKLTLHYEGQWYQVQTQYVDPYTPQDALLKARVSEENAALRERLYGSRHRMAVRKKQLSRRERKKANLDTLISTETQPVGSA